MMIRKHSAAESISRDCLRSGCFQHARSSGELRNLALASLRYGPKHLIDKMDNSAVTIFVTRLYRS